MRLKRRTEERTNPSLQRQALLNTEYGLFEVVLGIYQVPGFDLANISFVKGKTGWIVVDPLTKNETSRSAPNSLMRRLANGRCGGDHLSFT